MSKLNEKRKNFALKIHIIMVPIMLACVFMAVKTLYNGVILMNPFEWTISAFFTLFLMIFITNSYTRRWFFYDDKTKTLNKKEKYKDVD